MTEAPEPVNSIVLNIRILHNVGMKKMFSALLISLGAAACTPWSIYYREGVTVTRMETDQTECEVSALRDAPVANQIRQHPPTYYPARTSCDAVGNCITRPGYWVSGGFYTVDVNLGLRERLETICMAKRGYQPIELPRCSPKIKEAAPVRPTLLLPPLSEAACVITYDGGSWQIVNPVLVTPSD